MSGFSEGYRTGAEVVKNPFAVLLDSIGEGMARRRAEDKKRADEENALRQELIKLGAQSEYDKALQQEKQKGERRNLLLETKLKEKGKEKEISQTGKLLKSFGMGGGEDEGLPEGVSVKMGDITFTGKATAEEKGAEEATKEAFTRAEGIKRATRRLGSIVNQFNKALPAEQKGTTTTSQRISGIVAVMGAKTGFKPNPDLLALQDTAKLQLRAILRDMGEGARMSDQDIQQNLAVIEQAGLSNEERKAKIRSFMQVAIDSMDDAVLDNLKKDKTTMNMLMDFGVTLPSGNGENKEDSEYQEMLYLIGQ